jgi:amino acid transporter
MFASNGTSHRPDGLDATNNDGDEGAFVGNDEKKELSAFELDSFDDEAAVADHRSDPTLATAEVNGHATSLPPRLGVLPLAMIVFFNVSGGPFGMEESVRSAGFFFTILGFVVMPFVWSIPESLITAELGAAYPEASGGVAWVEEAFGSAFGWMAGYLGWVAGATDNAIYPVLFLDYVFQLSSTTGSTPHPLVRFLLLSSVSITLGFLNWLGLQVVGNMSIVIGLLSLAPFVVMIAIGSFQVDPTRWLDGPTSLQNTTDIGTTDTGESSVFDGVSLIQWRPFLNSLFWNLNSFDSTASFAAEVDRPGRTLPRAMFWAIIVINIAYIGPLLVAIGATDSTPAEWVDGYLARAAGIIGGAWLEGWVVLAAGIANIALFQAELSADAFQLMGMAERGFVPSIFSTRSRFGTPTYGIVLGVAVIVAMGSFDLDNLIEMLNLNYAIALLMEYAAFLKLRVTNPDGTWGEPLEWTRCGTYIDAPRSASIHTHSLFSLFRFDSSKTIPHPFWHHRMPRTAVISGDCNTCCHLRSKLQNAGI